MLEAQPLECDSNELLTWDVLGGPAYHFLDCFLTEPDGLISFKWKYDHKSEDGRGYSPYLTFIAVLLEIGDLLLINFFPACIQRYQNMKFGLGEYLLVFCSEFGWFEFRGAHVHCSVQQQDFTEKLKKTIEIDAGGPDQPKLLFISNVLLVLVFHHDRP